MVRSCEGGATSSSFLVGRPCREHAPFPRHEAFPMVAESKFVQAPVPLSTALSEMQESVPTSVELTPLHAEDPRQDLLPKVES